MPCFLINTLLAIARARLKDADWERDDPRPACQQAADAMETGAREFLAAATAQGWDGDAEALAARAAQR